MLCRKRLTDHAVWCEDEGHWLVCTWKRVLDLWAVGQVRGPGLRSRCALLASGLDGMHNIVRVPIACVYRPPRHLGPVRKEAALVCLGP